MLFRSLMYVSAVGFSRFGTIFLGFMIAFYQSDKIYAQYVLFLTLTNMLTSFSIIGIVPRILSLSSKEDNNLVYLLYGAVVNLLLVLFIVFIASFFDFGFSKAFGLQQKHNYLLLLTVILYCFGFSSVSLVTACFNRIGKYDVAAYLWIFTSLISVFLGIFTIKWGGYKFFLIVFSLSWFVLGTFSFAYIYEIYNSKQKKYLFVFNGKKLVAMVFKSIYSGLVSLPFFAVFFFFSFKINVAHDLLNKSAFFLGFQFFTIAIFLPGVLGGILVPEFAKLDGNSKKQMISKLSIVYLFIGLVWFMIIWLSLPFLFKFYSIHYSMETVSVILLWQATGVIAALGAIQNQILVSLGHYTVLLLGGVLWALVAIILYKCIGLNLVLNAVIGVFIAYMVLQLFYWYCTASINTNLNSTVRKKINFLANPNSPHVRHWEELLNTGGYALNVLTAHPIKSQLTSSASVNKIIPVNFFIPMVMRYVIAGFVLRLRQKKSPNFFYHAHNTSGYGLTAFLSGSPYLITTYGSEIFDVSNRGVLYRFCICKILKNAFAITSTSPKMTQCLIQDFLVEESKIFEFSLGVSNTFFCDLQSRVEIRHSFNMKNSPVWISNRRIHPLYHSMELINAFINFREKNKTGFLILLEGDSDFDYLNLVKSYCAPYNYIILIKDFVSQDVLRQLLSVSDFCISVPESDQLSSSILEGAACGAVPLLVDLESYALVRDFSMTFNIIDPNNAVCYEQIFDASFKFLLSDKYCDFRRNMLKKIENFKLNMVIHYADDLYKIPPKNDRN